MQSCAFGASVAIVSRLKHANNKAAGSCGAHESIQHGDYHRVASAYWQVLHRSNSKVPCPAGQIVQA
eukprot:5725549-Amphidinium_carterae.1